MSTTPVNFAEFPFPFIGARLEVLISTTGVRYQGTLLRVDSNERSITLVKVLHFGSEGRPTECMPSPPKGALPEAEERTIYAVYLKAYRVMVEEGPTGTQEAIAQQNLSIIPTEPSSQQDQPGVQHADTAAHLAAFQQAYYFQPQSGVQLQFQQEHYSTIGHTPSSIMASAGQSALSTEDISRKRKQSEEKEEVILLDSDSDNDYGRSEVEEARQGLSAQGAAKKPARAAESDMHLHKPTAVAIGEETATGLPSSSAIQPLLTPPDTTPRVSAMQHEQHPPSPDYGGNSQLSRSEVFSFVSTLNAELHQHKGEMSEGVSAAFKSPEGSVEQQEQDADGPYDAVSNPQFSVYFIAQLAKSHAVGVLMNGNQHPHAPVYMRFNYSDMFQSLTLCQVWMVKKYEWTDEWTGHYKSIKRAWLNPNTGSIYQQAKAIRNELKLLRFVESVTRPGHVTVKTYCPKRQKFFVEVKAEGAVKGVQLSEQNYDGEMKSFISLKQDQPVQVQMSAVKEGCWVGHSYVLPNIQLHEEKAPFRPQEREVVRAKEGEYVPVKIWSQGKYFWRN